MWRPIPGWEKYEVSMDGQVRRAGRVLKPLPDPRGYPRVNLSQRGRRKTKVWVHRMVLLAFRGPVPSPAHECAHNDGNKQNCTLSNLRWATRKENNADRIKHGTHNDGERNGRAKLTSNLVRQIRAEYGAGQSRAALARAYGVAPSTIYGIVKREIWMAVQ